MEDDSIKDTRFKVWLTLVRHKFKRPCVNLSNKASKRCVLVRSIPNNTSLKELYFKACVFGPVRDIVIKPPEERRNSSRFVRIEFFRKSSLEKFLKDFDYLPFFAGCKVEKLRFTDILLTLPEDRINSSRFARIEFRRKSCADKFLKQSVNFKFFQNCPVVSFKLVFLG
jgi:hypothetical protein